jgi:hypothetical protein
VLGVPAGSARGHALGLLGVAEVVVLPLGEGGRTCVRLGRQAVCNVLRLLACIGLLGLGNQTQSFLLGFCKVGLASQTRNTKPLKHGRVLLNNSVVCSQGAPAATGQTSS